MTFAATVTRERVSVGEIVAALGDRGLGVLIAIFAIPNMLPSAVPFGNTVVGIFPLIFAVHLACGFDRLMLPAFVANRSINAEQPSRRWCRGSRRCCPGSSAF